MWFGALDRWLALAIVMIAIGFHFVVTDPAARRWLLIGIAGTAVSATGLFLRTASIDSADLGGSYQAEATVTGDLSLRESKVVGQRFVGTSATLPIRIERLTQDQRVLNVRIPARLQLPANSPESTPSSRIAMQVRIVKRLDEVWLVSTTEIPKRIAEAGFIARGAQRVRLGLRSAASHLPQPSGGLLPGLVVGDTSRLSTDLESAMRATNLTHLTAVSGANLALVAAFVVVALRFLGLRRRALPWLTALAILSFVVVARPDPSVLRAAVMAGVLILATALEIPGLGLTALLVAVVVLVLVDPFQAQRPGFVLSVLATAGLLLFAQPWAARLEERMPRWLAASLAVPLAAQALCTPYLVVISGQLSLIGIWTNLLVAPAVAPATILGFLAALVSLISPTLAQLVAWLSFLPLWWITAVARFGSALPFANLRWFSGWLGALLSALVIVICYLMIRWRVRLLIGIYLCLAVLIAALRIFTPMWPMPNWSMAMCDVGQGDGIVIRASKDQAVVIDAGPNPAVMDRCLRDLGIEKVPLIILTHHHADHVEGLTGVLRNREVLQVWLSPEVEPVFESQRVRRWVRGIETRPAPVNQPIRFPLVELTALWPTESIAEGSVPNNASIVIAARWAGRSALLMADVELQAQQRLRINEQVDILKVAHHGSANQDFALLAKLNPRVALISVGAINPYGHPSTQTLAALNIGGATIYRTDRDGSLALAFDQGGIAVAARGHPWWWQ